MPTLTPRPTVRFGSRQDVGPANGQPEVLLHVAGTVPSVPAISCDMVPPPPPPLPANKLQQAMAAAGDGMFDAAEEETCASAASDLSVSSLLHTAGVGSCDAVKLKLPAPKMCAAGDGACHAPELHDQHAHVHVHVHAHVHVHVHCRGACASPIHGHVC